MEEQKKSFKPGDVVELRGGSRPMTVITVNQKIGVTDVVCSWHDNNGHPHNIEYPVQALRAVGQ